MKSFALGVLSALALLQQVSAQATEWQQCGGINWTGPTTCVSGLTCTKLNDWYYQCLRSSSTVTPTSTSSSRASSSTSSSSSRASSSSSSSRASSSSSSSRASSSSTSSSATPSVSVVAGNPYTGKTIYLSPYYRDEVIAAAALVSDATLKAKILTVQNIPTFTWFDVIAKVPKLEEYLADAAKSSNMLVQIVVYDLPNRDCHANASNGELFFDQDGMNLYKGYINGLAAAIKKYPSVRVVAVIEPDSLANLVTNMSDPRCANAATGYKDATVYAVSTLAATGAFLYLDAGHAGWLGWPANITPAAALFADIYTRSGGSNCGGYPCIRGLATNVANYNALRAASPDPVTSGNANYDEIHYIDALAPLLSQYGFPAHFIVDQGRSGVQNIRTAWGNWCNIEGAGFGTRPTLSTGSSLIDAIVWIKPGGECDGTSDTSATRYDSMCGGVDAKTPAPEAGQWFQAYFIDLVNNANPAL